MKSASISRSILELVQGDITHQEVDAIVNAANSGLRGGGGVDGAIHRAGGPTIMEECRAIGGCPTGSAVATGAGNLNAKYLFHAVGPIWKGGNENEPNLLEGAYATCLALAAEHSVKSISFPSISTGVYGYPVDKAAEIALSTVIRHLNGKTGISLARFVLFDEHTLSVYSSVLNTLMGKS